MAQYLKDFLSKTVVTIGAPTSGGGIGILSFFESINPALVTLSLVTGIVLGILSYRLKLKKQKESKKD